MSVLKEPAVRAAETADALKAKAVQHAGLSDFGDDAEYLPGLRRLLQAVDTDMPLTAEGRGMVHGALLGSLTSRLYAHEGWKQRPDCLTRPIKAPVIILGLPRTGTTALHRLLSFDPQFQGPELWLMGTPMPRPPRATWEHDARYRECAAITNAMNAAAPQFAVIHPRGADLVDECNDITLQCFMHIVWGGYFPVPSYDAWWPQQDHGPQYRYLYRVLQLIGADDARPWLLKDPSLITRLPQLVETFPDARLIYTHRDPLDSLPSFCSLVRVAQTAVLGDRVDSRRIGQRSLEFWSQGANQLADAAIVAKPHIDIYMKAFQADPMRVVREIYEQFGLELSAKAEAAMRTCIAEDRAAARPPHSYTLEEFGLDAKRVREKFAPYIECFHPFNRGEGWLPG